MPVPPATTSPATRWSPPQLGPSLQAAVEVDAIWRSATLPILTTVERDEARAALAVYEAMPRGTSHSRIAKMMGVTATGFPQQRLSDQEADARLKLYQGGLEDIDDDVLALAFSMAVRESRFFPTVAELRELARKVPAPRRYIVIRRLKTLLAREHEAEIAEVDLVRPEQLRELIERLGSSLAAIAPAG